MRLFFAVILWMMFFFGRSLAQEDNVNMATSALQEALATLKQSVEKLSLDNDQLAARDNAMKARVVQLQTQWGRLEAQGDLLNKTAEKLRDKNFSRGQQIVRLEKENSDLDNRIQKALGDIKLIQESMVSGDRLQKEKLRLMKMIYDSQQRQESLHESILRSMSKNSKAPRMTVSGHIEEGKLQSSIDDLNRQGVGLRANLDALLSQMVDLDKRKARLEEMVQHLP